MALDRIEVFDSLALDALKKYGLENTCKARLLQISENITYLVENKESLIKEAVMRISRPGYHTLEELDAELKWLKEIKNYTPLIVADPIRGKNGLYVQIISSWMIDSTYACVLYEFLEGSAPDEEDPQEIVKHFRNLGETTAYLHRQAKMWQDAKSLNRFSWNYETMIGDNAKWGSWKAAVDLTPNITGLLDRTSQVIKRRLNSYGANRQRFGLIHADLRLANLLVEGDQIKVIDFDDCGFGWFMHDLASSVSFIEVKPITADLTAAWIEGYSRIERLTPEDLAEVDTFVMQRRLQLLAWIASHFDSDPVKELNRGFTEGTAILAERYLEKFA